MNREMSRNQFQFIFSPNITVATPDSTDVVDVLTFEIVQNRNTTVSNNTISYFLPQKRVKVGFEHCVDCVLPSYVHIICQSMTFLWRHDYFCLFSIPIPSFIRNQFQIIQRWPLLLKLNLKAKIGFTQNWI